MTAESPEKVNLKKIQAVYILEKKGKKHLFSDFSSFHVINRYHTK